MLAAVRFMSRTRPTPLSTTALTAARRLGAVQRSMATTVRADEADNIENAPVQFRSDQGARIYILNKEKTLNALDGEMIDLLRPQLEIWNEADTCKVIIGTGKGRALCAGGDVRAVTKQAATKETRHHACDYFKKEFELDYVLATLDKPYVAILDGITMGGGLGLSMHAPFRIATEKAQIAMPETKIGYMPDVGATYFLPRLDGALGRYLALTGNILKGKAVYQHSFATHYVPSVTIPDLISRLASLDPVDQDPKTMFKTIDDAITEFVQDAGKDDPTDTDLIGDKRVALDACFSKSSVEEIISALEKEKEKGGILGEWAKDTLEALDMRSPTALRVALEAQKRGVGIKLADALKLELQLATVFCSEATSDFVTGVSSVLEKRSKDRPDWKPPTLADISQKQVVSMFFDRKSQYLKDMPEMTLDLQAHKRDPMEYALPTEEFIGATIRGEHSDGAFAKTKEDVLRRFVHKTNGKLWVKEKVEDVIARKTRATRNKNDKTDPTIFLEWTG